MPLRIPCIIALLAALLAGATSWPAAWGEDAATALPSAPATPTAPAPEASPAVPAPEQPPATSLAPTAASAPAVPVQQTAPTQPAEAPGPRLLWVEFSVGGQPVQINAGGVLALHPDAPFRVLKAKSDAWFDLGLSASLGGLPTVDMQRFHTLSELLGEAIFSREQVQLQVHKGGRLLGGVQLMIKLLPIDWLRRAEAATRLPDKIENTRKALELTPDDRLLSLRLVDLLEEAKRHKEAADLLQSQAWIRDDPARLTQLLDLYLRQGQLEAAAQVVTELLDLKPDDIPLLERLAWLDEQLERWEEVTAVLERLTQIAGEDERSGLWLRLAQVLLKSDKKDQALTALQRAAERGLANANAWRVMAEIRGQLGDPVGALEAQRRAAQLAPADLEGHLSLSEAYQKAGYKTEAAAELDKAVHLRPDDNALWLRLARLYEKLEDRPALLKVYQHLTKASPHDPDLDYNLGVLLMDMERWEPALESLNVAARAKPLDCEVARLTMEALLRLKRWDQALLQAQVLLKDQPAQTAAVLERLYAALAKERPQALAGLLDLVLASGAKQANLYQLRAVLALDKEDTPGAIKTLELGVKNLPQNLALQLKLAELYEAAGQDQKALQAYERLLDKDSTYQDAQGRYLQLKTGLLSERKSKGGSNESQP
ncbi:Tetratricopeptide repeat protein [Desulfarculales bacterium]